MRYLRDSDYLHTITQNDLFTLIEDEANPDLLILGCELKTQEQISMFLRKRYDLNQLFAVYPDYESGVEYATGNTVWYSQDTDSTCSAFLYKPKSGSTAKFTIYQQLGAC